MVRFVGRAVLAGALGLVATAAFAVPAHRNVVLLEQPDGRSFRGRLWGDERQAGHETEEGFTVERDLSSGYWHYLGTDERGASSRLAARPGIDPVPPGLTRGLRPRKPRVDSPALGAEAISDDGRAFRPQAISEPAERAVPATGIGNVPVILVNFSDKTTTFGPASFETLLFASTYSMAAYYSEVSYGAYTVSSGPEGIAGWYQASNTHDYYGTNVAGKQGDDQWPGDLVYEAAVAADAAGFDFAPYDQDGDCYVDNIVIIHQGGGEEFGGAPSTNIWSHSWYLSSAQHFTRSHYGAFTTNATCPTNPAQKVRVDKYTIQPELYGTGATITTIGVVAHEFGHALGLPDLYDTDGTPNASSGAGDWTIMAGGSWNGRFEGGDRPAHFGPWEKWRLGWITPTLVVCPQAVTLPAASGSAAGIFRLREGSAPGGTGEYFLVENRQNDPAAGFDDGLPGSGLLVWHVDETRSNNEQECWPGPATPPAICSSSVHYKVAVVQADNLWELERSLDQGDAGDPFPGTSDTTAFHATSTPNSNLYSGAASGVSVTSISASGATRTATLAGPGSPTLTVSKTGTGTVASAPPGISCGATCAASFACGTPVSLSATPGAGSVFAGWSGDCTGSGSCALTMNGSKAVTAAFSTTRNVSIGDVSTTEGDSGTKVITFTVTADP